MKPLSDGQAVVLFVVVGIAVACLATWLSSLIWPPPHPFFITPPPSEIH